MDYSKSSRAEFQNATDRENHLHWFNRPSLPQEKDDLLKTLAENRDEEIGLKMGLQETNKAGDIEKEFQRLFKKEHPANQLEMIKGLGVVSKEDLRSQAEHNILTRNENEINKIEQEHLDKVDEVFRSEGIYIRETGNTQLNLDLHFNERGKAPNQQDHGHDNGR